MVSKYLNNKYKNDNTENKEWSLGCSIEWFNESCIIKVSCSIILISTYILTTSMLSNLVSLKSATNLIAFGKKY